ncbi:MAG: diphosphate--fructose-6-phosphate 1-phosphotransferase [Clostridiales Family XIII bacterium]|jgi:6-phosphofructokinase 1|nr:diphosphate--fructose-6-phosphate 1-phosphotransferase [Clostridiales Family XIII bacterium]
MGKNALVALGGGPSPVINASLLGVIEGARSFPDRIDRVYGALHGIEGVLLEELVDLGAQDEAELAKLYHTPSSGSIGTCRYKLHGHSEEDYGRVIDVLGAHGIGYFFYIGGNDSMDTAHKVSALAHERGMELIVAGVPKTIDNDLGDEARTLIDHTPGYGSAARYWATLIRDIEEENRSIYVSESVCVLQAMGRKSGFITAAARLADPGREFPIQMYFAETGMGLEELYDNVRRSLTECGRCIVVVNEGFNVGDLGEAKDGFGHPEYGASEQAAAQVVANHLNRRGLPSRGQAVWQVPGVMQRSTSACRSSVDAEEAREVGMHAVKTAVKDGTGWMATILRDYTAPSYKVRYDKVRLDVIAKSERFLPPEWIDGSGVDVNDAFVEYARPLIGEGPARVPVDAATGIQDFAALDLRRIDKRCPAYVPLNFR